MLKYFSLKNYKSYSNEQTIKISDISLLAGANSGGKSSVSQAFMLIMESIQKEVGHLVSEVGQKFQDYVNNKDTKKEIKFSFEADVDQYHKTLFDEYDNVTNYDESYWDEINIKRDLRRYKNKISDLFFVPKKLDLYFKKTLDKEIVNSIRDSANLPPLGDGNYYDNYISRITYIISSPGEKILSYLEKLSLENIIPEQSYSEFRSLYEKEILSTKGENLILDFHLSEDHINDMNLYNSIKKVDISNIDLFFKFIALNNILSIINKRYLGELSYNFRRDENDNLLKGRIEKYYKDFVDYIEKLYNNSSADFDFNGTSCYWDCIFEDAVVDDGIIFQFIKDMSSQEHLQKIAFEQAKISFNSFFKIFDYLKYINVVNIPPIRETPKSFKVISNISNLNLLDKLIIKSSAEDSHLNFEEITHMVNWELKSMGIKYEILFELKEVEFLGKVIIYNLKDLENNLVVSIEDVGFGVSQILPILYLIVAAFYSSLSGNYVPKYLHEKNYRKTSTNTYDYFGDYQSIIIVEQPELHLHPKAQAAISFFFAYNSGRKIQTDHQHPDKNTNVSWIIETHSENLVLGFQKLLKNVNNGLDMKFTSQNISTHFVDKQPGQKGSEILYLRINDDGYYIDEWPIGFYEDRLEFYS